VVPDGSTTDGIEPPDGDYVPVAPWLRGSLGMFGHFLGIFWGFWGWGYLTYTDIPNSDIHVYCGNNPACGPYARPWRWTNTGLRTWFFLSLQCADFDYCCYFIRLFKETCRNTCICKVKPRFPEFPVAMSLTSSQ
jgi:hypothetical protein